MEPTAPSEQPPVPTLPTYGPPLCDPKQAKPLQKLISRMFRPKVRANRHPRQLSFKSREKKKYY